MPEAANWPTFRSHWEALSTGLSAPPCVLIDAAGVEGHFAALPLESLVSLESLFDGELADECAEVGPWLGQALSWDEAVARALRRHPRKFSIVHDDQGKPHQFRCFDARVLLMPVDMAPPLMDLRPFLRPFAGLPTVDGVDEIRHIRLVDGRPG